MTKVVTVVMAEVPTITTFMATVTIFVAVVANICCSIPKIYYIVIKHIIK